MAKEIKTIGVMRLSLLSMSVSWVVYLYTISSTLQQVS